jgi:hypothetical protein
MANVTKVTAKKKAEFCDALAETANVTKAALATGISRREWYRTRDEDAEFRKAWDAALELGTDALEDEAVRRAHEGTLRPVFYQGQECGAIREYSDTLLIFVLKARRPEKFKERSAQEIFGPNSTPVAPVINLMLTREFGEFGPEPACEAEALPRSIAKATAPRNSEGMP